MTYKKRFDSINMIPLIDVMLVMLVIVLTTATFISQGIIKVDLPKSKTATKIDNKNTSKDIIINKNGEIFFNKNKISLSKLKNIIKTYEKNVIFTIRSDKEAKFDTFVSVIDILKSLNREKIAITTMKN
jgi:biopolymer transport protein ExbD